jgi:hypothetical protein
VLAEAEGEAAFASAEGAEAEADPAGVVAEAEAEGVLAPADWSAGAVVVVVVLVVVWSVELAAGAAEAEVEGVVLALEEADWSLEAGAALLGCCIAPPEPEAVESVVAVGCAPLCGAALSFLVGTGALLLVTPESVTGAVEFGLEGSVELLVLAEAAAPEGAAAAAPVVLQDSEIIFISETLNLLSEPIEPVKEAWCPTCASRPLPSSL